MTDVAERAEYARMIRDSADFLVDPDLIRARRAERYCLPGFDRAEWQTFADLGWFGLRVPAARGGAGLGMGELCVLAEQLGAGLVTAPVIAAIVIAPLLPDDRVDRAVAGEAVLLPAWQERRGSHADSPLTTLTDGRVTGEKRYVAMAAGADAYLVTTRDGLAIIERDAPGVELSTDLLQDGGHFGTLHFEDASAIKVAGDIAAAREELTLATAAYLLGAMRRAFAITTDYLSTREQFGRPIGSFQALQHGMVDLHMQIELTRASVAKAAAMLDDGVEASVAVSRAKARASDAAMLVTRRAVQYHGGIGFTDEHDIGLYLRKALVLANQYGSAAEHRARFARIALKDAA